MPPVLTKQEAEVLAVSNGTASSLAGVDRDLLNRLVSRGLLVRVEAYELTERGNAMLAYTRGLGKYL
ncbi:MAG: hypothetical protein KGM43_03160 [Planctomycetota bacterium]|nr:hypothetical protein [Planctomycetota bacterium]